jgi:hypothetical protein
VFHTKNTGASAEEIMKSKRIIMLLGFVCVLALVLSIPSTLVAGEKGEAGNNGIGCKPQGTWISDILWPAGDDSGDDYTVKVFMTFHDGTGDNDGTLELDYVNPWPGSGFLWTINRGVWKKSRGNTYKFTYYASTLSRNDRGCS